MPKKLLRGIDKLSARTQALFACGIWIGSNYQKYYQLHDLLLGKYLLSRVIYQKKEEIFLISIGGGSVKLAVGFSDGRWDQILEVVARREIIYQAC